METHSQKFKVRLGLFIAGGLAIFVFAIFIIGRQKNLFNPVFTVSSTFYNVSGLQVGNKIRFSGINVGTVDNIIIINDSTVKVFMMIRKEVKQFIFITQGSSDAPLVREGQQIVSEEPIEMDAIMASLKVTADNAAVISYQLAEIMIKVNSGTGTLGRLIRDSTIAGNLNQTMVNLKNSSKGLDENMNAAKEFHNNKYEENLEKGG